MNAAPTPRASGTRLSPKCHSCGLVVSAATPTVAPTTHTSRPNDDSDVNHGESASSFGPADWSTDESIPTVRIAAAAPMPTAANGPHSGQRGNSSPRRSGASCGGGPTAVSGTEAIDLEYAREVGQRLDHGGRSGAGRVVLGHPVGARVAAAQQYRRDADRRRAGNVVRRRVAHVHGVLRRAP